MSRIIQIMCFLVMCCSFIVLQVSGEKLTAERLQEFYKHSRPGEMVCYYHGMLCRRDSQVCSPVSRGCEDVKLFNDNMTEEEKCLVCQEYLEGINVTTKQDSSSESFGYPDVCLYVIGQAVQNNIACGRLSRTKKDVLDVTQDTCLLPNSDDVEDCERGKGYCNATGCQPLFPEYVKTDEERSQYCKHVNKSDTQKYDSCVYALGLIVLNEEGKSDESDPRPQEDNTLVIAVSVLGTLVSVAIIGGIFGLLYCYKRKKCMWAPKEQGNREPKEREKKPQANPDDQNAANEGLLNANNGEVRE